MGVSLRCAKLGDATAAIARPSATAAAGLLRENIATSARFRLRAVDARGFDPSEWSEPVGKRACDALAHRGNCRSRHQTKPLPRAHDLDLLGHQIESTSLSAAGCEQQKPKQDSQPA